MLCPMRLIFLVFFDTCIICVPCNYQCNYFYFFVIGPLAPAVASGRGARDRGLGVAVPSDHFQFYDDVDYGNLMPLFTRRVCLVFTLVKSSCVGPGKGL